jgi:hypothetical protein
MCGTLPLAAWYMRSHDEAEFSWQSELTGLLAVGRLFVGTLFEAHRQFHNVIVDFLPFLHFTGYAGVGVHDGGVVTATEYLANVHEAHTGHFPGQIHGYLPGKRHVLCSGPPHQIVECEMEVFGNLADDVGGFDLDI